MLIYGIGGGGLFPPVFPPSCGWNDCTSATFTLAKVFVGVKLFAEGTNDIAVGLKSFDGLKLELGAYSF
jgi:hypothetical protein